MNRLLNCENTPCCATYQIAHLDHFFFLYSTYCQVFHKSIPPPLILSSRTQHDDFHHLQAVLILSHHALHLSPITFCPSTLTPSRPLSSSLNSYSHSPRSFWSHDPPQQPRLLGRRPNELNMHTMPRPLCQRHSNLCSKLRSEHP